MPVQDDGGSSRPRRCRTEARLPGRRTCYVVLEVALVEVLRMMTNRRRIQSPWKAKFWVCGYVRFCGWRGKICSRDGADGTTGGYVFNHVSGDGAPTNSLLSFLHDIRIRDEENS